MVKLVRDPNMWKDIERHYVLNFHDKEYEGYYINPWCSTSRDMPDGYHSDFFGIVLDGTLCGSIIYDLDIESRSIYDIGVFIFKEYLDKGLGVVALVKFLEYATKTFFKLTFSCVTDNTRAKKIYDKILNMGGVFVGTYREHTISVDGKRHDLMMYELICSEFKPDSLYKKLLKRG
jgi:RimJ/RimL family protein N-acetyltransferase